MNLKLAKIARKATRQAYDLLKEKNEAGVYLQHQTTGSIICAPNSPRGVYKRLKKWIGRHPELRAKFNKVPPQ